MALDEWGLHALTWNLADETVGDVLVASPMDAPRGAASRSRCARTARRPT